MELRQAFVAADGKVFYSKAEAQAYMRRPMIKDAMSAVTGGNEELTNWLVENQEAVEVAFEQGTIKRVSKSEKSKLEKALAAVVESGDHKFQFLIDNHQAIADSFRWPAVKRMNDEEKLEAAKQTLVEASDGNAELADWVIANKDAILTAYKAGIQKREVPAKAQAALAAYRAKKAAEKAAKEAKSA